MKKLLKKTTEVLMKKYCSLSKAAGKMAENLANSVASRFVGMARCISRAISKWRLREIFQLDNLSDELKLNLNRTFSRKFCDWLRFVAKSVWLN